MAKEALAPMESANPSVLHPTKIVYLMKSAKKAFVTGFVAAMNNVETAKSVSTGCASRDAWAMLNVQDLNPVFKTNAEILAWTNHLAENVPLVKCSIMKSNVLVLPELQEIHLLHVSPTV